MGSEDPTRCPAHGLLLAPDGGCVRCQLDEQKAASARVVNVLVAIFAAGVIAIPVWWFLRNQRREPSVASIGPEVTTVVTIGGTDEPDEEEIADEEPDPEPTPIPVALGANPWAVLDDEAADAGADGAAFALPSDAGEVEAGPSPEEQRRALEREQAIEREMTLARVTIYTAPWCSACKEATAWLRAKGIHFVEYNIEADSYAAEKRKRLTSSPAIPTIEVEGKVFSGLNRHGVTNAIREAATKRVDRRRPPRTP